MISEALPDMSISMIINADDFGLTSAVNEEIVRCIENGVVTSTSLIACGRAADEAVRLAKSFGEHTGLGVHLTLDSETPISDPVTTPTIVSKRGTLLPRSDIMLRLLKRQVNIDDVHRELSAQIEKVINAGLHPDHLDGHGHIQVFPTILSLIIDIAKQFNISAIRLPVVPWGFKRLPGLMAINLAAKYASMKFKSLLRHPDFMLGFSSGGCYSESIFLKDVDLLKRGEIVEAMFHPGPDKIDVPSYNAWGYKWAIDSATLRSNRVRDFMAAKNVKLITFNDLPNIVE
jgi:predicted glycoside hydrolase/deacetylase ChbG (UPF0249 family)